MREQAPDEHGQPTRLACRAPRARAVVVAVAGRFNGRDPAATPLAKDADGDRGVLVDLPAGCHECKFAVDGAWCCEPGCEGKCYGGTGCVPDAFGTMSRVVEVGG